MPDFTLKTHKIQFSAGALPRPHCGAQSAPPEPLARFQERKKKGEKEGEGK